GGVPPPPEPHGTPPGRWRRSTWRGGTTPIRAGAWCPPPEERVGPPRSSPPASRRKPTGTTNSTLVCTRLSWQPSLDACVPRTAHKGLDGGGDPPACAARQAAARVGLAPGG